jgi:hypothetical protein
MSEYRMAPSQYMDGKAVIYLASGHLTGQPNKQPLQFAFAWDGNVPSLLCLVSCASVFALGKNPIEWLLRGELYLFFVAKPRLNSAKDAASLTTFRAHHHCA